MEFTTALFTIFGVFMLALAAVIPVVGTLFIIRIVLKSLWKTFIPKKPRQK